MLITRSAYVCHKRYTYVHNTVLMGKIIFYILLYFVSLNDGLTSDIFQIILLIHDVMYGSELQPGQHH